MTCNLCTARNDIALFFLFILAFGTKETQKDTHRHTYSSRRYFCKHLDRRLFVLSLRSHNPRHARCVRACVRISFYCMYSITYLLFSISRLGGAISFFRRSVFAFWASAGGLSFFSVRCRRFRRSLTRFLAMGSAHLDRELGNREPGHGKLGTGKWMRYHGFYTDLGLGVWDLGWAVHARLGVLETGLGQTRQRLFGWLG
jgi:hypothetical protein